MCLVSLLVQVDSDQPLLISFQKVAKVLWKGLFCNALVACGSLDEPEESVKHLNEAFVTTIIAQCISMQFVVTKIPSLWAGEQSYFTIEGCGAIKDISSK